MFSADELIIQKLKLDLSITKPRRYQFEAAVLIKSGYYVVPSPSSALPPIFFIAIPSPSASSKMFRL